MVVYRVVVMVVVGCHLVRDMCGYGSARSSSLALRSCCGGGSSTCVGGVFEGSLRGTCTHTWLLLKDQRSAQRASV